MGVEQGDEPGPLRPQVIGEGVYTVGPLVRTMIVIVGAIAELERNLIVELVRAGMRRAKLEGRAHNDDQAPSNCTVFLFWLGTLWNAAPLAQYFVRPAFGYRATRGRNNACFGAITPTEQHLMRWILQTGLRRHA